MIAQEARPASVAETRLPIDYQVVLPLLALVVAALVTVSGANSTMVWYTVRASGIVAYLLLTLSVCAGLMVQSRTLPAGRPRVDLFEVHNFAALLVLGGGGFHAFALLLDSYVGFSPAQVLVPFTSAYRPLAVAAGILALYLGGAIYGSFWAKRFIGQRAWRTLHYGSFLAFLLATLHGIFAGADSGATWMVFAYVMSIIAVLALLAQRVRRTGQKATASVRAA